MQTGVDDSWAAHREAEVTLDGQPVELPRERRSLNAIRSYLETLALEQQRILCSFSVDGTPASLTQPSLPHRSFSLIEGQSISLEQIPLHIIETALHQAAVARNEVHLAVALVMINDGAVAREFWWKLTKELKTPLLTLSLLPTSVCGPGDVLPNGQASLHQLRKWQLEQLASLIKRVDEACWAEDVGMLSNALENHVLPWLDGLQAMLDLWRVTFVAGHRAGRCQY